MTAYRRWLGSAWYGMGDRLTSHRTSISKARYWAGDLYVPM